MSANFFKSKQVFLYSAILFAALTSADPFLHHEGPEEGHVLECQLCSNDFAETIIQTTYRKNSNYELVVSIISESLVSLIHSTSYISRAPPRI
mgnify:CR=1 FL=1|tara:strand:+ start:642 stop:920 length:279 start_codon:yes stop_codon:yes gene_type:complete